MLGASQNEKLCFNKSGLRMDVYSNFLLFSDNIIQDMLMEIGNYIQLNRKQHLVIFHVFFKVKGKNTRKCHQNFCSYCL